MRFNIDIYLTSERAQKWPLRGQALAQSDRIFVGSSSEKAVLRVRALRNQQLTESSRLLLVIGSFPIK